MYALQLNMLWWVLVLLRFAGCVNSTDSNGIAFRSSFSCHHDTHHTRAHCLYSNLVYFKGRLMLVVDDEELGAAHALQARTVATSEHGDTILAPSDSYDNVADYIQAVTAKQLEQRLHGTLWDIKHMEKALLVQEPNTLDNWWHRMDEAMSWGLRWCQMLGTCTYDAAAPQHAALISHGPERFGKQSLEDWKQQGLGGPASLFECWARTQLHANGPEDSDELDDIPPTLYVFAHAAAGPGNATMHPFLNYSIYQDEAFPQARQQVMGYMRTCAGLPAKPPPRDPKHIPRITLLNRRYTSGRGLLRLDEVFVQLRRRVKDSAVVDMQMLEGLTFAEQVKLFDSTDILLMSHGAAAMNLHFLPLVSVIIDINSWLYGNHQASIVSHMPPPYRVQQFTLNKFNVSDTEPVVSKIREHFFNNPDKYLTCKDRLSMFEAEHDTGYHNQSATNHKFLNVVLNVTETLHVLKRALQAWHHMHNAKHTTKDTSTSRRDGPQHPPSVQSSRLASAQGVYGGCRTWCGDVCVDTETSTEHCGYCGNACDAGVPCKMGFCCNLLPAWFVREPCLAGA